MLKNGKKAIENLLNLLGAVNNLTKALIDEKKDDIKYWNNSINTWKGLTDKSVARVLKEIKDEEENLLGEGN